MALTIEKRTLPDRLMILPDLHTFFGDVRQQENLLDIKAETSFADIAQIYLTRGGSIGITFLSTGPLASIVQYQAHGEGEEPEYLMQNRDDIVALQGSRLHFANFIAGALFGRLAALRHSPLRECRYVGMDRILAFAPRGKSIEVEPTTFTEELFAPKIAAATKRLDAYQIVKPAELDELVKFFKHLSERQTEFTKASLQSCMLMNYQAAILHHEQQSAASLALNSTVAEALIEEVFYCYGLVGTSKKKAFAQRNHSVAYLSANQFKDVGVSDRIMLLAKGGFFSTYFADLFAKARLVRNDLMHRASPVAVRQAGELQAVIRELWGVLLDHRFELLSGWGMRV